MRRQTIVILIFTAFAFMFLMVSSLVFASDVRKPVRVAPAAATTRASDSDLDTSFVTDTISDVARPTHTPTPTPQNNVPVAVPVKAGGRFVKKWRMTNSGTFDWGSGYKWVFVSGDRMGAPEAIEVPPTAAGQELEVEVPMQAPPAPGSYKGVWQMKSPEGKLFGGQGVVAVKVNVVQMNAPVSLGPWQIRAATVNREKVLWKDKTRYEATGIYALVRMQVSYAGPGTGWMSQSLKVEAHAEDGYTLQIADDDKVGDAARWMISNQAALDFDFQPGTTDWPIMVAFDVPEDAKELWLDLALKDKTMVQEGQLQQVSIYLRPTKSKKEQVYEGTFIDAQPMD